MILKRLAQSMTSHYRWVIFFVCFVIFFAMVGVAVAPFSLYIVPVTEQFGFSRGDFTVIFTIKTVVGVMIQLSLWTIIKRVGLRWVVVIGSFVVPVGFFFFAQATTLWMFYLGGLFVGIGFSLMSITPITLLIDQWFEKGEGLILGLISAGSGFGGAFFTRIIGKQIVEQGFQSAFLFSTIILAATAIPVFLFVRPKPEAKAEIDQVQPETDGVDLPRSSEIPPDLGETIKSSHLWLALLAVFLIGIVIHPVILSTPAYLLDKGFDAIFGATISGAVFLVLAFAKIFLGFMHDRLGIRASLLISMGSFVASTLFLVMASSPWMVWAFALLSGTGAATLAVLIPLYARELLGQQRFRHLLGVFVAVVSAGVGVGTPLINYVYDLSGSYSWMVAIYGAIGLIALLLAFLALDRKQASQAVVTEIV
jgi:MFS family permease